MARSKKEKALHRRSHLSSQLTFPYSMRDGHRAGRPEKPGAKLRHVAREQFDGRCPVHVVLRLVDGLPSLRKRAPFGVLRGCFAMANGRFGLRLVHYSVQGNHLHLMVEAEDRRALSRGMQGLTVRMAKGLNKLWGRKGKVFSDRYFGRALKTPLEVKRTLAYVFHNGRKHGVHLMPGIDPYCSGRWFEGWKDQGPWDLPAPGSLPPSLMPARTWLLRVGWQRHGLLAIHAA